VTGPTSPVRETDGVGPSFVLLEKPCTKCHETKPAEQFTRVNGKKAPKHGLSSWCKSCQSEVAKKWNRANPEKCKANFRKWAKKDNGAYYQANKERLAPLIRRSNLKLRYGITPEQYEQMFRDQNGVCAICSEPPLKERLCVDHDHKTGAVRELLCKDCNVAIARFRENPDSLAAAINYLNKHTEII
jgi:hypothetical protein